MRTLVILCFAACSLCGQTGSLAAPSAGLVFDPTAQALRRIQGIPGAALIGAPLDFGFPLSGAFVAPRVDSAFVRNADGPARLFRLTGDSPVEVPLDSLVTPRRVVFSPSGTAAALESLASIQVVTGLPNAPAIAAAIPLRLASRTRRGSSEALAISDDGGYVLFSSGGPVELITVASDTRRTTTAPAGSLAAFAPGSHNAAALHAGKLILYQDTAGAATERTFPPVASPSALAFSADSQKLFITSAVTRAVTTIQLDTGARTTLPCDCEPSTLAPMGQFFRLTELGTGPLWLLDPAAARPLLFVPAPTR